MGQDGEEIAHRPNNVTRTSSAKRLPVVTALPSSGGMPLHDGSVQFERNLFQKFSKFFVYVVDVDKAEKIGNCAEKTMAELNEDVLEAMGLALPAGQQAQSVFVAYDAAKGYHVPHRDPIESDNQLHEYFSSFGGNPVEAAEQTLDPEVARVANELNKLRLGGVITKLQMQKFIRQLILARDENHALRTETAQFDRKWLELEESVDERIAEAVDLAEKALDRKKEREKSESLMELKKQLTEVADKKLKDLRTCATNAQKQLQQVRHDHTEAVRMGETLSQKVSTLEKEKETVLRDLATVRLERSERDERIKALEQVAEEAEQKAEKACEILKRNGLDIDEYDDEEEGGTDKYCLVIKNIEAKLSWDPERVVAGPELPFGDLENVQMEFYPGGVSASSFDGWAALRLRVPNATRIHWQVLVGSTDPVVIGPRSDDFHDSFWWCRKGLLWQNFCKHEVLREKADSSGCVSLQLKVLQVSALTDIIPLEVEAKRPLSSIQARSRRQAQGDTRSSPRGRDILAQRFDEKWLNIRYKDEDVTDQNLSLFVVQYLNRRPATAPNTLPASTLPAATARKGATCRPSSSPALRRTSGISASSRPQSGISTAASSTAPSGPSGIGHIAPLVPVRNNFFGGVNNTVKPRALEIVTSNRPMSAASSNNYSDTTQHVPFLRTQRPHTAMCVQEMRPTSSSSTGRIFSAANSQR